MRSSHSTPQQTGERPRVLFVNTRSSLGADVSVHIMLIQNLHAIGVDVFVATNQRSRYLDSTLQLLSAIPPSRIIVCDLGQEIQGELDQSDTLSKSLRAFSNIKVLRTLGNLADFVRNERISILHTTDRPRDAVFTTMLARMTGANLVLHVHVKWTSQIGRGAQWAAKRARSIVGISRFTCESLIEGGLSADRVFLAHNSTDATRFDPSKVRRGQLRARLGIDGSVPLVGIVGRFTRWKGHLDLVTAFERVRREVPEARLAIIGRVTREYDGPDGLVPALKRRIEELKLESAIHWLEWTEDVPAIMMDLDVMAMPSFEEPFGLVATECMAMGRPVVGYASGALPEIVRDKVDGVLVSPGDTDAMAAALIDVLRNPERRETMGTEGRQRVVEHFSPGTQARRIERLYSAIAAGAPVPRI